ncbi:MAG: hypothetical protein ACT4P6_23245 [Gemmatimonadaceae bacterium]
MRWTQRAPNAELLPALVVRAVLVAMVELEAVSVPGSASALAAPGWVLASVAPAWAEPVALLPCFASFAVA